ncbi:MAG: ATP-binding cassette domain-containing protein [Gammaproteobacteria bacterium]|jgi:ATP-binding cassette subfamily F protein 3|nr:ATP-binding cassette domain-containing protein [Gammaproteobacteria bacterium]
MLSLTNLTLRRGAKVLFRDAGLQVHAGQRVGVTGANGSGKSSLFALLLGDLVADAGEAAFPRDWVVAHVAQETPPDPRPAIDYVLDGDAELRVVEAGIVEAEQAHDGHRLAELHAHLEAIGGYEARSRAARLLHGLGFRPGEEERPVEAFSGGWRMRLNLGRALMCRSDLLLLDEPTNHLDLEAVVWLEEWLCAYRGTLLLISHDRDFLDGVCSHILHIEREQATLYTGNYSAFERIRAERLAGQQAAYAEQQREIAHIRRYVDRFRAKATKARQAQSRLKALERMELIAPAHVDSPFHFAFRPPERAPNPLLRLDRADAGYDPAVPVLRAATLTLSPGDRIGLLGVNGAGKSTLVKLLAGELPPLAGVRDPARDLQVGYFAQHQLEQLRPEWTPVQHLLAESPALAEQEARDFLGGFGFVADQALAPVAPFSGGEKARLVLALVVHRRPNLLLLDEPTNHLDLEMRHALGLALQTFEGAMVLVSHDRHLLRSTVDRLWLIYGGCVTEFQEGLDDYPRWLAAQQQAEEMARNAAVGDHTAAARRDRRRSDAEERKRLQPLRRAAERWEGRVEELTAEQGRLESRLADPALYEAPRKDELKTLLALKARVDAELGEAEAAWLDAIEALDNAAQG